MADRVQAGLAGRAGGVVTASSSKKPEEVTDGEPALVVPVVESRRRNQQSVLPDGRRALTLEQVATALQTDVRTVRKLIRLGKLRAKQLSERITRVPEESLFEYMQQ